MDKFLVVSGGDPSGTSSYLLGQCMDLLQTVTTVLFGSYSGFSEHESKFVRLSFSNGIESVIQNLQPGKLHFVEMDDVGQNWTFGAPDAVSGKLAFDAFVAANRLVEWALDNRKKPAFLTMPLSKQHVCLQANPHFSGHTGWLSQYWRSQLLMLLTNQYGKNADQKNGNFMRVIPLTEHIPLGQVPAALEKLDFKQVINILQAHSVQLGISPTSPVALLGVNPHAGEGGKIGSEELDIQNGWIEMAKNCGLQLAGPFPADGFFASSAWQKHSVILGNYHDQVLIPLKMFAGFAGMNISLGLPFLRLSPDHGPGFGLVQPNLARSEGTRMCLEQALAWLHEL